MEGVNGISQVLVDLQPNLLFGRLPRDQQGADRQADAHQNHGKQKFRP
jgi:hypothetical protein